MQIQIQSFLKGERKLVGKAGVQRLFFCLFCSPLLFWHLHLGVVKGMSQADPGRILGLAPMM